LGGREIVRDFDNIAPEKAATRVFGEKANRTGSEVVGGRRGKVRFEVRESLMGRQVYITSPARLRGVGWGKGGAEENWGGRVGTNLTSVDVLGTEA